MTAAQDTPPAIPSQTVLVTDLASHIHERYLEFYIHFSIIIREHAIVIWESMCIISLAHHFAINEPIDRFLEKSAFADGTALCFIRLKPARHVILLS